MKSIVHFLRRPKLDHDLADEFEAHLEEKIADLIDAGLSETEARAQASREFGNALLLRERSREVWGWVWLETLLQDLRYGLRTLRKDSGFTAVAATTLALAIALNSSIFSLVSAWLMQKPTVADPDRVVAIVATNPARTIDRGRISAADFTSWRNSSLFSNLAAVEPDRVFNLSGSGEPERLNGMRATANYFAALGAQALLGRTFLPGEDMPGRDHVVVLSHGVWQTRFASNANIIGTTIALDGEKYEVIGVMPPEFRQVAFLPRIWTPAVLPAQNSDGHARDHRSLLLVGRLNPGVALEHARTEMAALAQRAEQDYPASEKGWSANVLTLQEYGIQENQVRPALRLLMSAVILVLVIACANIANLLLVRASKRQHEIAIRTALGAARVRLIRQLLVESLLISVLGGSAGLLAANWGIRALRVALRFNEFVTVMGADLALDRRVLAFTCLVSIGAALVFGLAPAIRVSAADPQRALRQAGRQGELRRTWGRNLLVGCQIALAIVLVTSAGLMINATAEELDSVSGFDPKQILVTPVSLTTARYHETARQLAFLQNVAARLQTVRGVEAVGIATAVPYTAERRTFSVQGRASIPVAPLPQARYFAVSPEHLHVLSIPLLQGRILRESDDARAHRVAVVNRVFADRFFPGESPIGRYIRPDRDAPGWSEIVGVVGNIKATFGPREEDPQIYESYLQVPPDPEMWIAVRAAGDVTLLARDLRRAVWSVDPDQPIGPVQTLQHIKDEEDGGNYVVDALLAIFGTLALALAAIGIYGVVAYAVAQRTHEIGIRMALGAHRVHVLRSVLSQGMLLALVSAAVGLLIAAPLPKLFAAMLQGFRAQSAPIFFCVPLLLILVVLAALYVPASRAASVDPVQALRHE